MFNESRLKLLDYYAHTTIFHLLNIEKLEENMKWRFLSKNFKAFKFQHAKKIITPFIVSINEWDYLWRFFLPRVNGSFALINIKKKIFMVDLLSTSIYHNQKVRVWGVFRTVLELLNDITLVARWLEYKCEHSLFSISSSSPQQCGLEGERDQLH